MKTAVILSALLAFFYGSCLAVETKPNVLFILADDKYECVSLEVCG